MRGLLPDAEQDTLAALILAELEDERRWDDSFARSQDALARMAVFGDNYPSHCATIDEATIYPTEIQS